MNIDISDGFTSIFSEVAPQTFNYPRSHVKGKSPLF